MTTKQSEIFNLQSDHGAAAKWRPFNAMAMNTNHFPHDRAMPVEGSSSPQGGNEGSNQQRRRKRRGGRRPFPNMEPANSKENGDATEDYVVKGLPSQDEPTSHDLADELAELHEKLRESEAKSESRKRSAVSYQRKYEQLQQELRETQNASQGLEQLLRDYEQLKQKLTVIQETVENERKQQRETLEAVQCKSENRRVQIASLQQKYIESKKSQEQTHQALQSARRQLRDQPTESLQSKVQELENVLAEEREQRGRAQLELNKTEVQQKEAVARYAVLNQSLRGKLRESEAKSEARKEKCEQLGALHTSKRLQGPFQLLQTR